MTDKVAPIPRPSHKVLLQRHHDYYVTLYLRGELEAADQAQYDRAMKREADGKVTPLREAIPKKRALIRKK
jgi:hypothetical protein